MLSWTLFAFPGGMIGQLLPTNVDVLVNKPLENQRKNNVIPSDTSKKKRSIEFYIMDARKFEENFWRQYWWGVGAFL